MALHSSTSLYYTAPWLYLLYFTLLHSTMALLGCTCLYYTLLWLYWAILDSATLYYGSTYLYWTLLNSITLYYTPWLYLAVLDHTTLPRLYCALDYTHPKVLLGLYMTLLHSTMALLGSTSFYLTLLHTAMGLHNPT